VAEDVEVVVAVLLDPAQGSQLGQRGPSTPARGELTPAAGAADAAIFLSLRDTRSARTRSRSAAEARASSAVPGSTRR